MAARTSITRAISIRQPYVEQVLRGLKKTEWRSQPTKIKERVYIYASLRPGNDPSEWRRVGRAPGTLPTGVIVGSVEIVGCRLYEQRGEYGYRLRNPRRLRRPLEPVNQPSPVFWKPRF